MVEAFGVGRGRYYTLGDKYYKKVNNTTTTLVRKSDIDLSICEDLILNFLEKNGMITRADVVELLHLANSQAYRILKKMASAGKIKLVGSGAGAKYVLK